MNYLFGPEAASAAAGFAFRCRAKQYLRRVTQSFLGEQACVGDLEQKLGATCPRQRFCDQLRVGPVRPGKRPP